MFKLRKQIAKAKAECKAMCSARAWILQQTISKALLLIQTKSWINKQENRQQNIFLKFYCYSITHLFLIVRKASKAKFFRKQKENRQQRMMAELALSAKDQIHKHMDTSLEPKLDKLLTRKVKPTAMQRKTFKNFLITA